MILKVARRSRFTVVDRATIRDKRLSYRAMGVLVALLDAPEGASVNSEQLSLLRPEGRDAIRAALRELEECGYLHRTRERSEGGRMVTVSIVSERPIEAGQLTLTDDGIPGAGPTTGKPTTGKPAVGGPGALGKNPVPKGTENYHDDALRIVGDVYRRRVPKPGTPFRTAVGIVDRLLIAGHDQGKIERALERVATVSMSTLERELASPGRVLKAVDNEREAISGKVAL